MLKQFKKSEFQPYYDDYLSCPKFNLLSYVFTYPHRDLWLRKPRSFARPCAQ